MIVAVNFVAALVGLLFPAAATKSRSPVTERLAGIHPISAGRCPNDRGQLSNEVKS